jgi:hypothetical protein
MQISFDKCRSYAIFALVCMPIGCARSTFPESDAAAEWDADSGRQEPPLDAHSFDASDELANDAETRRDSRDETLCEAGSSPAACGPMCTVCIAPDNARPECIDGRCDFRCAAGFSREGEGCARNPIRPLRPQSTSYIRSTRVTFQWTPPGLVDEYELSVSTSPTMSDALTVRTTSPSHLWSNLDLHAETLFWRVRALYRGAEVERSSVWQFRVESSRPAADTQAYHKRFVDLDGDGHDDLGVPQGDAPATWGVYLYPSSSFSAPYRPSELFVATPGGLSAPIPVGDVDGDGMSDLIIRTPTENLLVRYRRGLPPIVSPVLHGLYVINPQQLGDINGDGFADVLASRMIDGRFNADLVAFGAPDSAALSSTSVLVGAAEATQAILPWSLDREARGRPSIAVVDSRGGGRWHEFSPGTQSVTAADEYWGGSLNPVGDMNGDGFVDFATPSRSIVAGSSAGPATSTIPLTRPSGLMVRGTVEPGDLNGDNLDDFVILGGSPAGVGSVTNELRIIVYFGSRTASEIPAADRDIAAPGVQYFGFAGFGSGAGAKRFQSGRTHFAIYTSNTSSLLQLFELDLLPSSTTTFSQFDIPVPSGPIRQPFFARLMPTRADFGFGSRHPFHSNI